MLPYNKIKLISIHKLSAYTWPASILRAAWSNSNLKLSHEIEIRGKGAMTKGARDMKYVFSLLLGLGVLLSTAAQAAPGPGQITLQNTPAVMQKADWDDWGYRHYGYRRHHWRWYHRHHHWGYRHHYDRY